MGAPGLSRLRAPFSKPNTRLCQLQALKLEIFDTILTIHILRITSYFSPSLSDAHSDAKMRLCEEFEPLWVIISILFTLPYS